MDKRLGLIAGWAALTAATITSCWAIALFVRTIRAGLG